MRRICVFAGSSPGTREAHREAARLLGRELAMRELELVYGGASVGLMGEVADAALAAGGRVIGVMPRGLFRSEVAHFGLSELREVGSMHERKAMMAELSDGFIALPGGYGTFDELFEIVTWAQIGLHAKPIGLLNAADYYAPLLALVHHAASEGFVPHSHANLLLWASSPAELLDRFAAFTPAPLDERWSERLPRP